MTCLKFPCGCPFCYAVEPRGEIDEHFHSRCPLIPITCPFSKFGCDFQVRTWIRSGCSVKFSIIKLSETWRLGLPITELFHRAYDHTTKVTWLREAKSTWLKRKDFSQSKTPKPRHHQRWLNLTKNELVHAWLESKLIVSSPRSRSESSQSRFSVDNEVEDW